MSLEQLQRRLANGRCYTAPEITPFVGNCTLKRLDAAIAFAEARRLFDAGLERHAKKPGQIIASDMDAVFTELSMVGVISRRNGDHKLALEVGIQLRMLQTETPKTVQMVACALTHIQRMFLEYGMFIGEFGIGLVIPERIIRTETEDFYPYIRTSNEQIGRAGEFYESEWGVRPIVGLDLHRSVANIRIMAAMVDDTSYARGLGLSSDNVDSEARSALRSDRELARTIKKAALAVLYGRTLCQAFEREREDDPGEWFLNLVNAHISTMVAHEKTHARLREIKAIPDSEITEEAIAMLGQVAYGPTEMALVQLFLNNVDELTPHSMARDRVLANLLLINGIRDDNPETLPDILELTPALLAQSARKLLGLAFKCKNYSGVDGILEAREIERVASLRFLTSQDMALLDTIKHDPRII
ncbi:Uncharacterised protein [Candidatus Bilamarchaeum dharawalense]|uniref:Uncharacterized protein n=1 Tax=Candidatus Bilamarchaeum dharawalense TaxID=2885759 RepID=A0A5E4LNZ0_9ARCH|nr:Uncharacterised protein [Candidatus Bilamarchaeum dharawalense]